MKPYNITTSGGYTKTGYTALGQVTSGPTYFATDASRVSLSCNSYSGDFETPTPFSYKRKYAGSLQGKVIVTASNKSYLVQDGYVYGVFDPELYVNRGMALDPYNKCLDKLYAQLRSDVDLSIDIYQGSQTVKMVAGFARAISNPTRTLATALNALVTKPKWRSVAKGSGSKWLEWQYGLRPTLETLFKMTEDLIGTICADDGCLIAKARATELYSDYDSSSTFCAPYGGVTHQIQFDDSRRCEIQLRCSIGDADRNSLSQFTSLNPLSFFHENVPLSFVLDWVYDVGGYLRSLETALATGLIFKSGYVTRTRQRKLRAGSNRKYKNSTNGSTYSPLFPEKTFWVRELQRSKLTEMPIPAAPHFKVQLGSARLLSLASLLTNLLNDHPPKRRR